MELAISSRNYDEAMNLALEHKVILTESMAEGMTLEKKTGQDEKALNQQRNELLLKIASTCKQQNSFHLAAKKYTQAGDKLKAMKSLLMSGTCVCVCLSVLRQLCGIVAVVIDWLLLCLVVVVCRR